MALHRENATKGAPHQKNSPHGKEQHGARREKTRDAASGDTVQLIFTLNAATGAVINIEKVDRDGTRHEVPKDETAALAGKDNLHEIEAALDEAFEAGISSVLEPSSGDEPPDETEEETKLRRVLLTDIINRNVRQRLQRRLVQRLILSQTLTH